MTERHWHWDLGWIDAEVEDVPLPDEDTEQDDEPRGVPI